MVRSPIESLGEHDAFVSPDDNYLTHAGGASAALWVRGRLARLELEPPPLGLGDVWVSPAGRLPAEHVLHAITVDLDHDSAIGEEGLIDLLKRTFDEAEALGCQSVALPIVGGAAARGGPAAAASALGLEALLRTVDGTPIQQITIACVDGDIEMTEVIAAVTREYVLAYLVLGHLLTAAPDRQFESARSLLDRFCRSSGRAEKSHCLSIAFEQLMLEVFVRCSGEAEPDATAPGELRQRALSWLVEGAQELESVERTEILRAQEVRNRLVHAQGVSPTVAIHGLLPGVNRCARMLAAAAGIDIEALGPVDERLLAGAGAATPPSVPEAATVPSPNRNLRDLRDFLLTQLPESELAALETQLDASGYQGERSLKVLEYCLRADDLRSLLGNHFRASELRGYLERLGRPTDAGDMTALAAELLDELGFSTPRRPKGLGWSIAELKRLRREIDQDEKPRSILGATVEIGLELEFLAKALLRFVSMAVFHKPPDALCKERGWLESSFKVSKCSLGKLLGLLERVFSEDPEADTRAEVGFDHLRDRVVGHTRIAGLRNDFIHLTDKGEGMGLEELKAAACDFADAATGFAEGLVDVFPLVVVIESVSTDRWRRRIVKGESEEGSELIFTDEDLRPGGCYFMKPFTNPIRVDPILVDAGDVAQFSSRPE